MNPISEYNQEQQARLKKRLWSFFSKYDPEKLSTISSEPENNIITKTLSFPISEEVCFQKMCSKYEVDPKVEQEDAKKMNLYPNDSNHDHHQLSTQDQILTSNRKTSIQTYSAHEKQRLARRLEFFFNEFVLGEISRSELSQKIEKLLLGDVSEHDLMKRLCDLHRVDFDVEEKEAKIKSLFPSESESTKTNQNASTSNTEDPKTESTSTSNNNNVTVCTYFGSNRDRFYRRVLAFYRLHNPKQAVEKSVRVLDMEETESTIFNQLLLKYKVSAKEEKALSMKFEAYPEHESCLTSPGGPICLYNEFDKERLKKRLERIETATDSSIVENIDFEEDDRSEDEVVKSLIEEIEEEMPGVVSEEKEEKEAREHGLFPGMNEFDSSCFLEDEDDNDDGDGKIEEESNRNDNNRKKVQQESSKNANDDDDDHNENEQGDDAQVDTSNGHPVNLYPPSAKKRLLQRLFDFYEKFDPSQLQDPKNGKPIRILEMEATENEIFSTLCKKYEVGIFDEQDQARFQGLLPVCAYDTEEQKRLTKRLLLFSKNFKTFDHNKIDSILQMPETEEQIFETLCVKYCNGKIRQEQAFSLRACVFPLEDEQDQIKKNAGTMLVKDYPFLEKEFRLRKRLETFFVEVLKLKEGGMVVDDSYLEMSKTEDEIFEELCSKYNVDSEQEEKKARAAFAFPKF